MDLNQLLFRYQISLIDMKNARSARLRRWAGECAEYYAGRIVSLRQKLGVNLPIFEHRTYMIHQ